MLRRLSSVYLIAGVQGSFNCVLKESSD